MKFLNLQFITDGLIINTKPHNLIFITRESCIEPGARVRSWGFSEKLKEKGFHSKVVSFVDKIGAKSGKDDAKFGLAEKLKYSYKGFNLLLKEAKPLTFIINRFNYHTIPSWLVAEIRKIPFVFDMDDWEVREAKGSKAEYLTRVFAKRSVFCIAASRYLEAYLSQFHKKVYYIPTAVDTDKFKPTLYKKKKDFVFSWHGSVNRIELIRYLKFIIECFLSLYEKYPVIKLYVAADGIYKKELVELIRSYGCENIIYQGWLDHNDIPLYLDEIDCGLVPLLDKTRFNLSKSPVKLFEYMAKAKPVVASHTGEAGHIIKDGHNGFLVSGKDEFILKMEQCIKNPGLAKDVGMAARKEAEKNYSLRVLGERFADILENIFNSSSNL